jgi:hypothetical protein
MACCRGLASLPTDNLPKKVAARRAGTLEDDYALGVIVFQFLIGKFPQASLRVRAVVYKRTRCPDWLCSKISPYLNFSTAAVTTIGKKIS